MLQQVVDFGKQLLALTRDTQRNKEDIKAIREELRETRRELADYRQERMQMHQSIMQMHREMNQQRLEFAELTRLVERLVVELKHQQENAEKEREIHRLHLQNDLLRHQHGLPPGEVEEE